MSKTLTMDDYRWAADALGCDLAAIRAVAEIEAAGSGFLPNGFPRILFETRYFDTLTGGRFRDRYPDLSTASWVKNYAGGEREYERLGRAMLLARSDALRSTSWGMFQVMGFHYLTLGFHGIEEFVRSMMHSERDHLDALVKYCQHHRLHKALRACDWATFAGGYNGPRFKEHRYDERLAEAYQRYANDPEVTQVSGNRKENITKLQMQLQSLGYDIEADGVYGPNTAAAIKRFQASQRLSVDGMPGPRTRAALDRAAGQHTGDQ